MLKSMTGYGRAKQCVDGREITVELKSVNNRYLDINPKMPRLYSFAEEAVKAEIRRNVARGKVDVLVFVDNSAVGDVKINLNRPILEGYLEAFSEMEKYGLRNDASVISVSRLPDVLGAQWEAQDAEKTTEDIVSVLKLALGDYDKQRLAEGEALGEDIRGRMKRIRELTALIEERSAVTVSEYRARLTAKMEEVLACTTVDEARILQEAAIFADRVAVDEETVRLRAHLDNIDKILKRNGSVGRDLDFYIQELNREANTTGSKAKDAVQAAFVVELKSEIEKIREQVQNLE